MMKKSIVVLGVLLMLSACSGGMFLGMPWSNVVNVDEYLTQHPDRKSFVQEAQQGTITQDMNYAEVELAIDCIDSELVIQKKSGVYGDYSGSYWLVGYYKHNFSNGTSTFSSRIIIFFEDNVVTGWLEL